jgi:aryl-alcohol dehydrogenase-like predicted oxidoreductase
MKLRRVGDTGLRVSTVGLGCNNFGWTIDEKASQAVVDKALDLGVTLFDTADYYGTKPGEAETVLGRTLGARRKDIVLVTKFGVDMAGNGMARDSSRRYILQAVEGSLKRLGTDWIDVYMIHWPDYETPMEETLRALDDLIAAGKIRYIACSNLETWRVVDAVWTARSNGLHPFIAAENQYSLLAREAEADMIPALEHQGLGFLPYFPLASGMLTGKYTRGGASGASGRLADNFLRLGDVFMSERNFDIVEALDAFARERGHTLLELAISWLASKPVVSSVICGATKPEQVEQNVAAAGWALTPEELADIDKISRPA